MNIISFHKRNYNTFTLDLIKKNIKSHTINLISESKSVSVVFYDNLIKLLYPKHIDTNIFLKSLFNETKTIHLENNINPELVKNIILYLQGDINSIDNEFLIDFYYLIDYFQLNDNDFDMQNAIDINIKNLIIIYESFQKDKKNQKDMIINKIFEKIINSNGIILPCISKIKYETLLSLLKSKILIDKIDKDLIAS